MAVTNKGPCACCGGGAPAVYDCNAYQCNDGWVRETNVPEIVVATIGGNADAHAPTCDTCDRGDGNWELSGAECGFLWQCSPTNCITQCGPHGLQDKLTWLELRFLLRNRVNPGTTNCTYYGELTATIATVSNISFRRISTRVFESQDFVYDASGATMGSPLDIDVQAMINAMNLAVVSTATDVNNTPDCLVTSLTADVSA